MSFSIEQILSNYFSFDLGNLALLSTGNTFDRVEKKHIANGSYETGASSYQLLPKQNSYQLAQTSSKILGGVLFLSDISGLFKNRSTFSVLVCIGAGALIGASCTNDDEGIENVIKNALIGALIGGAVGLGINKIKSYWTTRNNLSSFQNVVHERGIVIGKPTMGCHVSEEGYAYRSLTHPEIASIRDTGKALPPPGGKSKGGRKNVKHWSRGDGKVYYRPNQDVIRIPNDKLKVKIPAKANDIEVWNKETGQFEPILQGVRRFPGRDILRNFF